MRSLEDRFRACRYRWQTRPTRRKREALRAWREARREVAERRPWLREDGWEVWATDEEAKEMNLQGRGYGKAEAEKAQDRSRD